MDRDFTLSLIGLTEEQAKKTCEEKGFKLRVMQKIFWELVIIAMTALMLV